jgi:hypothetical protein
LQPPSSVSMQRRSVSLLSSYVERNDSKST